MVSALDERSPPLALKNGGSITNFKRHLSTHHPMFLTQKDLENIIASNLEVVTQKLIKENDRNTKTSTLESYHSYFYHSL